MQLQVTEVRINKTNGDTSLKAFASVTFGGAFVVHGVRVIDGKNGLFVTMPSRKVGDGFKDVAHPVSKEFKETLDAAVLAEFEKAQADSEKTQTDSEEAA